MSNVMLSDCGDFSNYLVILLRHCILDAYERHLARWQYTRFANISSKENYDTRKPRPIH